MSDRRRSKRRDDAAALPEIDRRTAPRVRGLAAVWRKLKGAFKRPIRIQRRGLHFHIVLVERRQRGGPFKPASVLQMIAELQTLLLSIEPQQASGMRQLLRLHDELQGQGWRGAEKFPVEELASALAQIEQLARSGRSRAIGQLIERLRILKTGAELDRERRKVAAVA